jgi:hypothetical protein
LEWVVKNFRESNEEKGTIELLKHKNITSHFELPVSIKISIPTSKYTLRAWNRISLRARKTLTGT